MENAKDSFYVALRNRLAVVNPGRTMLLRGVARPAILVEEAEEVTAMLQPDVFVLRWAGLKTDVNQPLTLAQMDCEILYTTGGTQTAGGLDRGRALEKMDAELLAILTPPSTAKFDYTTTPAAQLGTTVFWSAPEFAAAATLRDRLTRSAKVTVFAYQEAGEL